MDKKQTKKLVAHFSKIIVSIVSFTIILGFQLVSAVDTKAENTITKKKWKILHIMSYHLPWKWTYLGWRA